MCITRGLPAPGERAVTSRPPMFVARAKGVNYTSLCRNVCKSTRPIAR